MKLFLIGAVCFVLVSFGQTQIDTNFCDVANIGNSYKLIISLIKLK